ncbi:MAG: FtsW/RodA/SpoVE family cell cycle protein [Lachnospiraceae bacterium]
MAKEDSSEKRILSDEPAVAEGKSSGIDWTLLLAVVALIVFGLIMLYSASAYNARLKFGSSSWYVKKQLIATAIGAAGLFFATIIPYDVWKSKISIFIYLLSLGLVLLVLTPLGVDNNGITRWIDLKFFILQPSEVVKVAVILITSALIYKYRSSMDKIKNYIIILIILTLSAGLVAILTEDLGTAIIIFGIGFVMLFVSCHKRGYNLITLLLAIIVGVIFVVSRPHRMDRIRAWINVDAYADNESFQIVQALYAIGSGGIVGKGLGNSTQKMFVPEAQNDMIFAIICEELGIIGGILLLGLFAILIWRLWKIYKENDDCFGRLIITGVIAHLGIQIFMNVAVVTGLIPNTGVPLPFISYGGSSVIMTMVEIGLVQSVACGNTIRKRVPNTVMREDKEKGIIYYR